MHECASYMRPFTQTAAADGCPDTQVAVDRDILYMQTYLMAKPNLFCGDYIIVLDHIASLDSINYAAQTL